MEKFTSLELKLLLGPYDSVINYAPMTNEEFRLKLYNYNIVYQYIGSMAANWLSKFVIIQMLFGHRVSKETDVPGRHFSFVAVKQ